MVTELMTQEEKEDKIYNERYYKKFKEIFSELMPAFDTFTEEHAKQLEFEEPYNIAAADFIFQLYKNQDTKDFHRIFQKIEDFLREDDLDFGVDFTLFCLYNFCQFSDIDPKLFKRWLGPESRKVWGKYKKDYPVSLEQ